uniref:Uncharacterized protein n=1 Tax=Crocodylus porosus TaxID=8502 RepID=A0A7M4E6G1_CROPO
MELEKVGISVECSVFSCTALGLWLTELDVPSGQESSGELLQTGSTSPLLPSPQQLTKTP